MRRKALAVFALLAALLLGPLGALFAGELAGTDNRVTGAAHSAGGGRPAPTANHQLVSVIGEDVAGSSSTSTNNILRPGALPVFHFPGRVTDLASAGGVTVSSVTLTWSAPGAEGLHGQLQAGTSYFIRVTSYTVPDTFSPPYADVVFTTSGVNPGAKVFSGAAGLVPNTTYFAALWARDHYGNLSYESSRATFTTLTNPPSAPVFLAVHFTSVTAAWVGLPLSPPDASSKTAEGYRLEASTTNFGELSPGGIVHSSTTFNVALTTLTIVDEPTPLAVDSTYYFRVAALNWAGAPNYLVVGSTKTKFQINDPALSPPTYPAASSHSVTVQWDANGNLAQTEYNLQASTAADFSGGADLSSTTFLTTREMFTLAFNTTYYFRVNATTRSTTSGWLDLGSTVTWTAPPAAPAQPFLAVHATSATVQWLAGDNPLALSTYSVVFTTGSTFPNVFSGNVFISTRPDGGPPTATVTGLAPNTTYQLFVAGLNWRGAAGQFVAMGTTVTHAAVPLSGIFAGTLYSSATVSWSPNGNALGITTFTVVLTTSPYYPNADAGTVSLSTVSATATATLESLALNTTYFLFIAAKNHAQDSTGFYPFASTPTLAAQPGLPGGAVFTNETASSIRLNWDSGDFDPGFNPAGTTYYAQLSDAPSYLPAASSKTLNLYADFTGLSPNTTYYFRSAAYSHHHGTWTAFADFGSTVTLPAVAVQVVPTFVGLFFTSATVAWAANGNPANVTTYTVVMSPQTPYPNADPDNVVIDTAPAGGALSATVTGLNSSTTYYLFVRALNHRGGASAYASLGSGATLFSPKTWVGGGGNTNWYNAANWSPTGVPTKNDAVTIAPAANVSVTVEASSPSISFSSLTLGSPAGTFAAALTLSTNVVNAGSVLIHKNAGLTQGTTQLMVFNGDFTMMSGSSLTHRDNAQGTLSFAVKIQVTGTFDLKAGATITVTGKGYDGGVTNGGNGFGPGGGLGSATSSGGGSGAGHGGAGGSSAAGGGGGTYDSPVSDPMDAGSGGGGGDFASGFNVGGAGGGVVYIRAGEMRLNGRVEAGGWAGGPGAGAATARGAGGGGSGGAVNIKADLFSGAGVVISSGGLGGADTDNGNDPGGGGGGGRIALHALVAGAVCGVTTDVSGANGGGGTAGAGSAGTVDTQTLVPAPQNFVGSNPTATSIDWNWNLSTNADASYQVFSATGVPGASPMSPPLGTGVQSYTTTGLTPNTTHTLYVRASACSVNGDSAQFALATLAALPVAAGVTFNAVYESSAIVSWGGNGNPVGVTTYTVVMSTSPSYPNSDQANVILSTMPQGLGDRTATISGLSLNTTYYLFVAAHNRPGTTTAYTALGSTVTLAMRVTAMSPAFVAVYFDSATVRWGAVGNGQSSGYRLEASPSDFLTPGDVISSTTFNFAMSTLSIAGLDLATTQYFRVASLNHSGAPNYATLERLNFQIAASTMLLDLGGIDPRIYGSTVSMSSMVVTNVGNLPMTYAIWAATATAGGSPWALGLSPDIDTVLLEGLWNSAVPPTSAFSSPITGSTRTSSGSVYAGDQTAVAVPPGGSRTLWFKFWRPTSTISTSPERLRVEVRPVYP